MVPNIVYKTSPGISLLPSSALSLELELELLAPANFQVLGGMVLGRDLQSEWCRMSSIVGSGSLLMKTPCFFNCSFRSLKSASSTLGLFGGDLGEAEGVFLHVELTDIKADEMGETLAEDLAEYSRWASFSILM